jgi:4-amino-4-deoxy-L-arabinose transferase-like glycosyltransferase
MNRVLTRIEFPRVAGQVNNRPPWTEQARAAVEAEERADLDDVGFGDASTATTNSPIYYLLQAAAYDLSPSTDLLDRLALMRLVSALLSALTVACIYGFVRELLPGRPWAATVGGLAAAFQPLFGFISSGVNNDGLLYLCAALVLYGLARSFRLGLSLRRAALVGGALAIGTLAKTQLLAFAPAVAVAWLLLAVRRRGGRPALAWRPLAIGAAAVIAPLAAYYVLGQTVWDRPVLDRVGAVTTAASAEPNVTGLISYSWQLFLPRPPFLDDWFPGFALKRLWLDGLVGRFGWLDYTFPGWVRALGALAVALVAAGALATLARNGRAVRRRAGELLVYALAALGLAGAIAVAGYYNRLSSGELFEQARYLLPLLGLYAAAVALAIEAFGRRWARVAGSVLVLAVLAHTVFAQLLTLTRYYG